MRHAAGSHAPEFLGVDVTMPQAKLLYLVSSRPDMPMSAIAAELGVGAPAVSGLVDRLENAGLVERRPDASDRRVKRIFLTAAGRRVVNKMRKISGPTNAEILAGVDPADVRATARTLHAIKANMLRMVNGAEDED